MGQREHELLLIGIKGDFPTPYESDRPPSVIQAPRGKHSEKPDIVYDIIEKMCPNRTYLEMFARGEAKKAGQFGEQRRLSVIDHKLSPGSPLLLSLLQVLQA